MTQNDSLLIHKCKYCNYQTNRIFNLNRHHQSKHTIEIYNYNNIQNSEKNVTPNEKNVTPNEKIVTPNEKNVTPNEKNVNPNNICKKCYKIYKTKKSLIEHEKNCKGIDDLTCPRCMISFTTRHAKSRHIKRNNCKPKSIIHARKPNQQNIETQNNIKNQNIETQNNIENLENQNNITNNIYINNYGNERLDYLNYDKMLEIFKKAYDIPRLLTKELHFNTDFPENNNIINSKKHNFALIKENEEWIYKNVKDLVVELIDKKAELMQKFAYDNKDQICTNIDMYRYESILELLLKIILLKESNVQYKKQVGYILDMIQNSNE